MKASVARRLDQLEGKPVDAQLRLGPMGVTGSQSTVNLVACRWILPLFGRAIDRTMQRKEAAILMGVDTAQLSRQLSGEGHLSALRLGALPDTTLLALADELREHFGMLDRQQLIEQADALHDRARQLYAKAAQR